MNNKPSYEEWMTGDAVAIGRAIMEPLPAAAQVARAIAVLNLCRSHWQPVVEIEDVASVGADPGRWHEGHDVFDRVRSLTLLEERARTNDVYQSLLFVAEIAAKVVYNASGASAPFDEDSPWWIAANAQDFAAAVGDERVGRRIWEALIGVPAGGEPDTAKTERVRMYCPKCGDVLNHRPDGVFVCERGDMELSRDLQRRLLECFVARTRVPRETPLSFPVGGVWWCPACGDQVPESRPGDLRCPTCARSLSEFVHALIELHPHRRGEPDHG